MKTLQESIIGRKNSTLINDRTGLQQGDIVYLQFDSNTEDHPYMVILDDNLCKSVLSETSLNNYDISDGIMVQLNRSLSFIPIIDYTSTSHTDTIEYSGDALNPENYNIIKILRSPVYSLPLDDILNIIDVKNLKKIARRSRLVYNGGWIR